MDIEAHMTQISVELIGKHGLLKASRIMLGVGKVMEGLSALPEDEQKLSCALLRDILNNCEKLEKA